MQQQGFAVCKDLKDLEFCLKFLLIHFWDLAHLRKTWGQGCWVCFMGVRVIYRSAHQSDESVLQLFSWTFTVYRTWFSSSWPWGPSLNKTQKSGLWKSREHNMFSRTNGLGIRKAGICWELRAIEFTFLVLNFCFIMWRAGLQAV